MATKFKPNKKGVVTGTKKNDKIVWDKAWKKAITVNALAGNDTIDFRKSKYKNTLNGGDGNDIVYGGAGNDNIEGGDGADIIFSEAGNDILKGGRGNDTMNAGAGRNLLYFTVGDGQDVIKSGGGIDILVFAQNTLKQKI